MEGERHRTGGKEEGGGDPLSTKFAISVILGANHVWTLARVASHQSRALLLLLLLPPPPPPLLLLPPPPLLLLLLLLPPPPPPPSNPNLQNWHKLLYRLFYFSFKTPFVSYMQRDTYKHRQRNYQCYFNTIRRINNYYYSYTCYTFRHNYSRQTISRQCRKICTAYNL